MPGNWKYAVIANGLAIFTEWGSTAVLAAGELAADHPAEVDVAQAQSDIRMADVLTLVYPLWWMSMPAIMKGYIDRVFARGFAYEVDNGVVRGLLSGRKAVLITVSGRTVAGLDGERQVECDGGSARHPYSSLDRVRVARAPALRRNRPTLAAGRRRAAHGARAFPREAAFSG